MPEWPISPQSPRSICRCVAHSRRSNACVFGREICNFLMLHIKFSNINFLILMPLVLICGYSKRQFTMQYAEMTMTISQPLSTIQLPRMLRACTYAARCCALFGAANDTRSNSKSAVCAGLDMNPAGCTRMADATPIVVADFALCVRALI